jgi:hypothetical protein
MRKARRIWMNLDEYEEYEDEPMYSYYHNDDTGTASCTLVRVVADCPYDEWAKEVDASREAYDRAEKEQKERAELERLKEKYS